MEDCVRFVFEGLWEGLAEGCEEVLGALAFPNLEYGVFGFVFRLGGESEYTEYVVRTDWVYCGDAEGDKFGGPDFSV